jgi:hypothetical protein
LINRQPLDLAAPGIDQVDLARVAIGEDIADQLVAGFARGGSRADNGNGLGSKKGLRWVMLYLLDDQRIHRLGFPSGWTMSGLMSFEDFVMLELLPQRHRFARIFRSPRPLAPDRAPGCPFL